MSYKKLIFNGIASYEVHEDEPSNHGLGLVIQTTPEYTHPSRDITTTHVPGRNGDVITDNKCYNNVNRVYNLAKIINHSSDPNANPFSTINRDANKILEWLNSAGHKYARLEDDYDPDVYRKAYYAEGGTINNIFNGALTLTVIFTCKPQRFLKSGEDPITYQNVQTTPAEIPNEYYYEAKPVFKFSGLPVGTNDVTLISVKDAENKETSLITVRNLETSDGDVTINSETEECLNNQNENINYKISLNGTNFPVLKPNIGNNKNKVSVAKYVLNNNLRSIPAYNSILSRENTFVESGFSTKDMTINDMASEIDIPSYDSLVASVEQKYQAQSFMALIEEKCVEGVTDGNGLEGVIADQYTTPNLSQAIANAGEEVDFSQLESDDSPSSGTWWSYDKSTHKVTLLLNGYILHKPTNKYIIRRDIGSHITLTNDSDIGKKVIFYQRRSPAEELEVITNIKEQLPSWLTLNQINETEGTGVRAVQKVTGFQFVANTTSTVGGGFVWTDKKNIFDKAKWNWIRTGYDYTLNLNSYSWNKLQYAFTADGAGIGSILGKNTSTTYTYKYVRKGNNNYDCLQYDAINGFRLFKVSILNNNLDTIQIKGTQTTGFYRLYNENMPDWTEVSESSLFQPTNQSSNNTFILEYLSKLPSYDEFLSKWPDWLEPYPYGIANSGGIWNNKNVLLNGDTTLKFKIKKNAWYRYHREIKKSDGTTDYTITPSLYIYSPNYFKYKNPMLVLTDLQVNKKDACRLSMIDLPAETNPDDIEPYSYDRYFKVNKGAPSENPPSWLSYLVTMNVKLDGNDTSVYECIYDPDSTENYYRWKIKNTTTYFYVKDYWAPTLNDKIYSLDSGIAKPIGTVQDEPTIEYKMLANGYIRWDNNTVWKRVYVNEVLLTSNYKDITNFYYLVNMPEYKYDIHGSYKAKLNSYDGEQEYILTRDSSSDDIVEDITYYGWKTSTIVPGPNTDIFYTLNEHPEINDDVLYQSRMAPYRFWAKIYKSGGYGYYELLRDSSLDKTVNNIRYYGWKTSTMVPGPDIDEWYTSSINPEINDNVYMYRGSLDVMYSNGNIIEKHAQYERDGYILSSYVVEGDIERNFIVDVEPKNDNPTEVIIKIAPGYAGYYKLETAAYWKYYAENAQIATALISEQTKIITLDANTSSISDVTLTVTPNWWTL